MNKCCEHCECKAGIPREFIVRFTDDKRKFPAAPVTWRVDIKNLLKSFGVENIEVIGE